jgi:hypothetical protein
MKTKNLLSLLAIVGIIFFASCKKEDPAPLTKDQATMALTSLDGNYTTAVGELNTSTAGLAQEAIKSLNFSGIPTKAPAKFESLKNNLIKGVKSDFTQGGGIDFINFDFPTYVGTWTNIDGTWTKTSSTPLNQVVIIFSFNGGTNNGTLTYYDYQTKTANSLEYISQLKAKVDIVGQTNPVMSWVYTANQGLTSMSFSLVTTLGTFTQTQSMSVVIAAGLNSYSMTTAILEELKKGTDIIYSVSANIVMTEGQTGYTLAVTAKVRVMDIEIRYEINANQNTDTTNPSNFMKVSVWTTSGAKVADVVFILNVDTQQYDPWLEFSDGSQMPVTEFFGPTLMDALDGFMSLFGNVMVK